MHGLATDRIVGDRQVGVATCTLSPDDDGSQIGHAYLWLLLWMASLFSLFDARRGVGQRLKIASRLYSVREKFRFHFFLSILLQVNRHRRQVTRRFQTSSRNNRNFSLRWINSTKWLERPRTLSEVLDSVSHRLDFISLVKPRPFTLRRHARLSLTFVFYFLLKWYNYN